MKTKEEMNVFKEELETMNTKLTELNEEELEQVTGGSGSGGGVYVPSAPSTAPAPSTPTESFTVPIKGEDNVHIDASVSDPRANPQ